MSEQSAPEPFVVDDARAWRAWLDEYEDRSDGVWLRLAKKNVTEPTSLGYQEALVEALCSGWIDGQRRGYDAHTFLQRFTPRRPRSVWSKRNVEIVTRCLDEGRLWARGLLEVDRAKADGRWERAYAGPASAEVPPELESALAGAPEAKATFEGLTRTERYSALHPILTAVSPATRERRIARLIARLEAR